MDLGNPRKNYKLISSQEGKTHTFGNRSEDIYYGRLAVWGAKKGFSFYFELEIKNPNLKLSQRGIWGDICLKNDSYVI